MARDAVIPVRLISNSHRWSKGLVVIVIPGLAHIAYELRSGYAGENARAEQISSSGGAPDLVVILQHEIHVVLIVWGTVKFPPQTIVDREVWPYAPAIPSVEAQFELSNAVKLGYAGLELPGGLI